MTIHKANEGIEAMRDELLHLETIGRLPRVDYKTGNPDFTAVMSSGCAITARMEADFSRLFSPTGATAQPPSPRSGGAGSSHCSCGFRLADCTCTEAV